ncbi:MAG: LemA family protein [Leptolyngbya sp. LCM1.Bin17]|nr:MAG: LemA family protein [Leptolyngbya sp. LCM1.Bin17]
MAEQRIPEDKAAQVFDLAARLYAQQNQSYSLEELTKAGAEVDIPPEFIAAALAQLKAQDAEAQIQRQQTQQRYQTLKIVGLVAALVILGTLALTYNHLATASQQVDLAWAQVENQFQRRADLIPNLVTATETGAQRQQELAMILTTARQNYLSADTPAEKMAAAEDVTDALNQFQTVVLANPELGTSQLYVSLQDELAGTENRVATERMRYNQAVAAYNQRVKTFPTSLVAGLFGFQPKPLFTASNPEPPTLTP